MVIDDLFPGAVYRIALEGSQGYHGNAIFKGLASELLKGAKYPPGTLVFECEDGETGFFGIEDVAAFVRSPVAAVRDNRRPDLKAVLMDLGNTLVREYGFDPAIGNREHGPYSENTEVIRDFAEWVNHNPAVQDVLYKLGFNWSM